MKLLVKVMKADFFSTIVRLFNQNDVNINVGIHFKCLMHIMNNAPEFTNYRDY